MAKKKHKLKTVNLTLRDSGPPFDLSKYQKITVPKTTDDENNSSGSADSDEEENGDPEEKNSKSE